MMLVVAAGAAGIFMQAFVRIAGQEIHPFEVVFIRNLMALLLLGPLLFRKKVWLSVTHLPKHGARGVIQVVDRKSVV